MKTCIKNIVLFLCLSAIIIWMGQAEAAKCENHPIFCQIVKNKPNIDKKYAMTLSDIIYKETKLRKIPANIYTAILMQESRYVLSAKNCKEGIQYPMPYLLNVKKYYYNKEKNWFCLIDQRNKDKCWPVFHKMGYKIKLCTDFGMSQIYYKTAKAFNFDIKKLTIDLDYSVRAGAIVLKDFHKRYSHKEVYWWTRYNSKSKHKREIYKKLVERYL